MSLIQRVVTWVSGQRIQPSDLNKEFNNIVNTMNLMSSGYGQFSNNHNTTTIASTSSWTNLGIGNAAGLYVFRDNTSGGTAVFASDATGASSIQNGITGFGMRYSGGQMQIEVTSGTTPRIITWMILQVI